jgi:Rieske Fe-S protein
MNSSIEKQLRVVESRRSFIEKCAGAIAGVTIVGIIAPLLQGCEPSNPAGPAGSTGTPGGSNTGGNNTGGTGGGLTFSVSQLTADGKALVTTTKGSDGAPMMIVRQSADTYLALSMRCTHQGCFVDPPPQGGPIVCSCHGSRFSITGAVVNGPASSPLKQYTTTYNAATGTVTVKLT